MTRPFPHFVLARAFLKPLLGKIVLCSIVLTALLEILALLEEASDILKRHLGIHGLIKFLVLHMPAMMTEIMPLSVMIGALFTLLQMSLSNEIAILRSSGLSPWEMYKHFLPAPILVSFLTIIMQFWVVPPCEQALNKWWNVTDRAQKDVPSLWYREHGNIVHIKKVLQGGNHLESVSIYYRDQKTGILLNTLHYADLTLKNDHWIASQKGEVTSLDHNQDKAQIISYDGNVPLVATPEQIINMTLKEVYYTPRQLWHAITHKLPSNLPPSNYLMAFFSTIFLPLQMAVMLLIAFPVTYIPPRAGLRNPLPVYVMATGLGVVILQGMISALGNAGSLPIFLAVCSGPIIATLFSLAWILRLEER